MTYRQPTFRQLESLVAVMETGSITRAAARLHISQPALSRLISSLESDLEYPLFRRVGGRVVPTAEAELLREEIQNALASVDRACRRARQLGSLEEGHLSICTFPSLAATTLPRLLSRFTEAHTKVSVTLNAMHWQRMIEEVALQRADFAISDLPARANGIIAEHICRYSAICIVRPDHPFASQERVPLAAIAAERFVSLGEDDEAGATVQKAFTSKGINLAWKIDVNLCASACAWVAASGGCAIVDPFAAEEWRDRLVGVPTQPPIVFDLWILRPENKPMTRLASAFLETLYAHATTLPRA